MPHYNEHNRYAFRGPARNEATIGKVSLYGRVPKFEAQVFKARVNRRGDGCELDDLGEWDGGNLVGHRVVRREVNLLQYGILNLGPAISALLTSSPLTGWCVRTGFALSFLRQSLGNVSSLPSVSTRL